MLERLDCLRHAISVSSRCQDASTRPIDADMVLEQSGDGYRRPDEHQRVRGSHHDFELLPASMVTHPDIDASREHATDGEWHPREHQRNCRWHYGFQHLLQAAPEPIDDLNACGHGVRHLNKHRHISNARHSLLAGTACHRDTT